jgi:hypothetical protein
MNKEKKNEFIKKIKRVMVWTGLNWLTDEFRGNLLWGIS